MKEKKSKKKRVTVNFGEWNRLILRVWKKNFLKLSESKDIDLPSLRLFK